MEEIITKLKPFHSKSLIVNLLGATGEGYFQYNSDENLNLQVKQALALNFSHGKLKVSMAGKLLHQIFVRKVKQVVKEEIEPQKYAVSFQFMKGSNLKKSRIIVES